MLPTVFGFEWSPGVVIFLGVFYTVVVVVATTLISAALRAHTDMVNARAEAIRWEEDFHDLPAACRACRHELMGEIAHRTCVNGFDCRGCKDHPGFLARRPATASAAVGETGQVFGLDMPVDRLYHRGHTWVQKNDDGSWIIGLDEFGRRILGSTESIALPPVGSIIRVNGTGWTFRKNGVEIRVLAPIDGRVIEHGDAARGWYLRVTALDEKPELAHLLTGEEIQPWLQRELERLQITLAPRGEGPSLADGGVLVTDPARENPNADWDRVYGEIFLEP